MAFSAMFDALFADPNVAQDATYTPVAGAAVMVRVIISQPDVMAQPFGVSVVSESTTLKVRVSDIANPVAGDLITISDVAYKIKGKPQRDSKRHIWLLETVPGE